VHRLWSTSWLADPEGELAKLRAAYDAAVAANPARPEVPEVPEYRPAREPAAGQPAAVPGRPQAAPGQRVTREPLAALDALEPGVASGELPHAPERRAIAASPD
jgi:hypothetical protein